MDTLAFGRILPAAGKIPDLHWLETCAAGCAAKKTTRNNPGHHTSSGTIFRVVFSLRYYFLAMYSKSVFGMFGGDATTVTLECKNEMAGVIIDRFGKELTRFRNNFPPEDWSSMCSRPSFS